MTNPYDPYHQGQGYPYQGSPAGQQYPASGGLPAGGGYPPTGGYPTGGGYPPQPPKKSNTGMIVAIVAVVVLVLGTLGITGFVAPGFFLSDDEESDGGGGSGDSQSSPQALADRIVAAINNKNVEGLNALKCQGAEPSVDNAINMVPQVDPAKLAGDVQQRDNQASAQGSITARGTTITATGTMLKEGDSWCWQGVSMGAGGGGGDIDVPPPNGPKPPDLSSLPEPSAGVPEDGKRTVDQFVDAINRNAAGSAKALACTDSVKDGVDLVLDRRPTIVAGETTGSAYVVSMKLSGTTSNSSSASGLASATQKDGKWCVSLFWFR